MKIQLYGEGSCSPFAQAMRTDFQVLRKGAGSTLLHRENFTAKTPSEKSEEFKKKFFLGELLFLGGSKILHSGFNSNSEVSFLLNPR